MKPSGFSNNQYSLCYCTFASVTYIKKSEKLYYTPQPLTFLWTAIISFFSLTSTFLLPHSRGWGWCLDDAPVKDRLSLSTVLPGVLYSAVHQCRLQYGSGSLLCDDMDVRFSKITQLNDSLCPVILKNVLMMFLINPKTLTTVPWFSKSF